MNMPSRPGRKLHRVWAILRLAVKQFMQIDGAQRAAAFAFSAFFSLFPLMILVVTISSSFVDQDRAARAVIAYMEDYFPISGEMQHHVFHTIAGVISARHQAGAVSSFLLVWLALQCFNTLVCATNRAWGADTLGWWRQPLKSLAFLAITVSTVFLGVWARMLAKLAKGWPFPASELGSSFYSLSSVLIPWLAVFLGLSLFYKLAPRRPTRFGEVWAAALCATALLQAAGSLFVIYIKSFATLNAVYGTFGGIMALLLWIYLSGCIFIFGACVCAAQAEGSSKPVSSNCSPPSVL